MTKEKALFLALFPVLGPRLVHHGAGVDLLSFRLPINNEGVFFPLYIPPFLKPLDDDHLALLRESPVARLRQFVEDFFDSR